MEGKPLDGSCPSYPTPYRGRVTEKSAVALHNLIAVAVASAATNTIIISSITRTHLVLRPAPEFRGFHLLLPFFLQLNLALLLQDSPNFVPWIDGTRGRSVGRLVGWIDGMHSWGLIGMRG